MISKATRKAWAQIKARQRASRATTHKPITVELDRKTFDRLETLQAGRSKAATITDLISRA